MIVDDEQLTRSFLKNIIPTLHDGWKVVAEASDGEEACEILAQQEVDLIITDIKMPIMDGVALCKYIHQNHNQINIVILSGYTEFDYAKQAIAFNVTEYLLKPIVNEELQHVLSKVATNLDQRYTDNMTHSKLINLSSKYQEEIISKLLQAIVSPSHVQIKALLPIIYELELKLIEEEGLICILQLSDDALNQHHFHYNNDLTQLLIYKTAVDAMKNTPNKVFLDTYSDTLIYIPLIHSDNLESTIEEIFDSISQIFEQETSMSLICFVGTRESEILQLASSYKHARRAALQSMLAALDHHIIYYNDGQHADLLDKLQTYVLSFGYALQNHDAITIKLMKNNLLDFVDQHVHHTAKNLFCQNILSRLCHSLSIDTISVQHILDLRQGLDILEKALQHISEGDIAESQIISTAKEFILNHYHEPISLSMIADYLAISPSYLSNLFHESVGQSYIKYLTEVRLKQATLLLKSNKNLTLEQITKQVGYISVKHFSYVFKKHFLMTPGEYRKDNFTI